MGELFLKFVFSLHLRAGFNLSPFLLPLLFRTYDYFIVRTYIYLRRRKLFSLLSRHGVSPRYLVSRLGTLARRG